MATTSICGQHPKHGPHGLQSKLEKIICAGDVEPLPEPDSDEEDATLKGTRVSVTSKTSSISVVPYAEIYGFHPSTFDFSSDGYRLRRLRALPPETPRDVSLLSARRH